MRISLSLFLGFALIVGLAGCAGDTREGPELARVTGTVTLDGEPLAGAHIRFSPDASGPAAFAESDEEGYFVLQTYEPGDGAIPGKYGISVTKEVVEGDGGMEFDNQAALEAYIRENGKRPPARQWINVVPEKYSNKKTSGLSTEVTAAQKNHVELELKSGEGE